MAYAPCIVVGCKPFLREDLPITGTVREPSDHLSREAQLFVGWVSGSVT